MTLVWRGDRLLVGRRAAGSPLAGLAEFPGGKCLPGESPAVAAIRECAEETGLSVTILGERCHVQHHYASGPLEIFFFDAIAAEGEPISPFCWVEREDLPNYRFPEANAKVLDLIREQGCPPSA